MSHASHKTLRRPRQSKSNARPGRKSPPVHDPLKVTAMACDQRRNLRHRKPWADRTAQGCRTKNSVERGHRGLFGSATDAPTQTSRHDGEAPHEINKRPVRM